MGFATPRLPKKRSQKERVKDWLILIAVLIPTALLSWAIMEALIKIKIAGII